jgi:hypothetical protein
MRAIEGRDRNRSCARKCRIRFRILREERLARRTNENGVIEISQFAQLRQNLAVLLFALAKTEPWIDHDPRPIHTSQARPADCRFQFLANRSHRIRHRGQFAPGFRLAAHVVQDQPHIAVCGNLGEAGIESQTTGVVEDLDAVLQRPLGNFGFIRVQRKGYMQVIAQPFQDRDKPLPLLIRGDSLRPGARGFGPDVDDVCALLLQFEGASIGAVGVVEAASVGERVRRNVKNAHNQRSLAQLDFRFAQLPIIYFSVHYLPNQCPMPNRS